MGHHFGIQTSKIDLRYANFDIIFSKIFYRLKGNSKSYSIFHNFNEDICHLRSFTVGSKIIPALQIIFVKKLVLMHFYQINICQVMNFRLYTVYKTHDGAKNWRSNQRKTASIIRALEIIYVKKLIPNSVLCNKYLSSHDI